MTAHVDLLFFLRIHTGHCHRILCHVREYIFTNGDVVNCEASQTTVAVHAVSIRLEAIRDGDFSARQIGAIVVPIATVQRGGISQEDVSQIEGHTLGNTFRIKEDVPTQITDVLGLVVCAVIIDVLARVIVLNAVLVVVVPIANDCTIVHVVSIAPLDLENPILLHGENVAFGICQVVGLCEVIEVQVNEVRCVLTQINRLKGHRLIPIITVAIVWMAEPVSAGAEDGTVSRYDCIVDAGIGVIDDDAEVVAIVSECISGGASFKVLNE